MGFLLLLTISLGGSKEWFSGGARQSSMDEYYGVGVLLSPLFTEPFTSWGTNNPMASAA
jgi:hypothetical protein